MALPVTTNEVMARATELGFKFTTISAGWYRVWNQETNKGYQGNLAMCKAWLDGWEEGKLWRVK